eukprot:356365-Chlamydomonas_euryale.AAC.4
MSRRVEPRCTAAVVERAMDPKTAPCAATPQPKAGPEIQIMDMPERRNEPAAPEAASAAPSRVAVEPHIAVAARPQNAPAAAHEDIDLVKEPPVKKRMLLPQSAPPNSVLDPPGPPLPVPPASPARLPAPQAVQRTVVLQPTLNAQCDGAGPGHLSDSDCNEERDTAQLELDGATTDGGAEKALPLDGAESEGQEPGSEDDDAAPADDGGTDDDAPNVQQLTAIAQRLIAQRQARDQRAQRGRLQGMSAPNRPQMMFVLLNDGSNRPLTCTFR